MSEKRKILVVYHYYERDDRYIKNFLHFMLFGYSRDYHYLMVIAGNCTVELPNLSNFHVIYTENKNSDYGGYAAAINQNSALIDEFDYFIFINSSVRGPYIPVCNNIFWGDVLLDKLVDNVGLVGSCINILPRKSEIYTLYENRHGESESLSHVQTMVYAMSRNVLKYLYDEGFYDIDEKIEKEEVIRDYEVRLTRLVIKNGWNIKCLLPEYNDIDYRTAHSDINPTSNYGDPNWKFGYFGRTVHPFEAMFIKINRNIYTKQYLDRLAYSMMHKSSYMENSHHLKMPRLNEYIGLIEKFAATPEKIYFEVPDEPSFGTYSWMRLILAKGRNFLVNRMYS